MNQRRSRFLTAAAVLLFLLALSLQQARASTWSNTVVDNTATATGKNLSVAVDPAGKLYVGYMDTSTSGSPYLKYANNANGSWALESLKNILPNVSDVGTATVYTPGGPRIMAYSYNAATGRTMYQAARKINGDGWQLQDIGGGINPMTGDPEPVMGTIAAGTQTGATQYMGFTFITYNDGTSLQYANERDMKWYTIYGSGKQSDMAIDSAGNIHVVFVDASGNLRYALNPVDVTSAILLQAGTASRPVANPSIAIDGNNTIHVVFTQNPSGNNYNVSYLSKTVSGSWASTATTLGSYGNSGGYTTLKVDSANNVHLAWYKTSGNTGSLEYREYLAATATWSAEETVTFTGVSNNYGQYAALAIDQYNNVNIAFYDVTNTSLNVVTKTNPAISASPSPLLYGSISQGSASTQTVTVTNKGNASLSITGAPTLAGTNASEFAIVTGYTCTNGLALVPGASCTIDVRFSPTTAGAKTATLNIGSTDPNFPTKAVTLKGTTDPSVTYTIYTAVYSNQMVAGIGGSISPAGAVSAPSGLNKTFTITPNPGYLIAGVYLDGTSMQDFGTPIGAVTSYTFTEVSSNHSITAVFYPVVPVTTWGVQTVDSGGTKGTYCSMDVDPNGKLYIGYLDTTGATPLLKYTNNRSGSWSTPEQVPIPDVTVAGTGTVYTPAGPRIMAYTYNATTLKRKYVSARKWLDLNPADYAAYYVTVDANNWQLQDIAGGVDPMGNQQPPITNTTTDTFTGAVQFCEPNTPCGYADSHTFISYTDGYNLWYANERDMYYKEFEPTLQVAGAGKQSDLAVDSLGNIHIVYYNPTNGSHGRLMYATTTDRTTSPTFTTTNLTDTTVSSPAITVDNNNLLHVVYVDANKHLQYINKTAPIGGTWSAPYDLGPVGSAGAYTSIKANGLDIVHIAFYSNSGGGVGQVMYAQRSASGQWTTPAAIPDSGSTNFGQYTDLVVDSNHNVNIAYYDVTNSSLKVATKQIPVIKASPASVAYGTVALNASMKRTVTVSNTGTYNLSVGTASIAGASGAPFTIGTNDDTCAGKSLAPQGSCTITVTFAPTATGTYSATLHVPSNDPYTSDLTVSLSGTAADGTHTVTASAGTGGSITPSGGVPVTVGADQSFTVSANAGYYISSVISDDAGMTCTPAGGFLTSQTCTLHSVAADHTVTASFVMPFDYSGTSIYYGTLQGAYDNDASGVTILGLALASPENLLFDDPTVVSLRGGYDCTFVNQIGVTTLGSITVTNGTVNMEAMVFQ